MFEPLKAIDTLNSHGVDYVVVGGWGTLQHGATRLTEDLDICPDPAPENLQRLAQALSTLHAELQIGPGETLPVPIIDGRLLAQMQIGNWSTDAGRLDVLQHIPGTDNRDHERCAPLFGSGERRVIPAPVLVELGYLLTRELGPGQFPALVDTIVAGELDIEELTSPTMSGSPS